jgi:DNA (cytosine-5)-methyltransferase 1
LKIDSQNDKQSLEEFLKSDKDGYSLSESQKKALEVWDPFLEWIIESDSIERIAKPLWATEALFCNSYDIHKLQLAIENKSNTSKITKRNLLKCVHLNRSSDSSLTVDELIEKYLPPYYRKIARGDPRSSDYKERAKFAEKSRNYMLEIQSWVEMKHGIAAWTSWVNDLQNQEMSFQKLEWNLGKEKPRKSKAKSALKRVQNRLKDSLVQFRSSGIRISKKIEFPTLVAIGQVAFTGSPMKQPHWTTLAKLQSIHNQELLKSGLFGDDKEAIKRLGNAANVEIIRQIAENLKQSIASFSE